MRISYISSSYVPSRRASSVQVMKMCGAFARAQHEVQLVTKRCNSRQEAGISNDFAFYGTAANFEIVKIARPAWKGGGLVFTTGIRRFLKANQQRIDLAYCRDLYGAWFATRLSIPTVMEVHEPLTGFGQRKMLHSLLGAPSFVRLVAISRALADDYTRRYRELIDRSLLVAHDGADAPPESEVASERPRAGSKHHARLRVGYVGQLYPGKGLEVLLPLADLLPGVDFEIVGGTQEALERLAQRTLPSNLTLSGFVPPGQLAERFASFDIAAMPYQKSVGVAGGRSDVVRWMSPLKMFEYMAAGKTIVSSDLPVLREVLEDDRNAILVAPDDPRAWARAIDRLDRSPELRDSLGTAARADLVAHYTWDRRAERVLEGIRVGAR